MSLMTDSPSPASWTGLWIHLRIDGGIQAGSWFTVQVLGSLALKSVNRPLDKKSARVAPSLEHRVIFSMVTVQPMAAATLPMAATSVVHKAHLVL